MIVSWHKMTIKAKECIRWKSKLSLVSLDKSKAVKWVSWILTRLNVLTGSQQTTPLIVGSHVTNCNREYQNTCKLETDVNYCCSCCACCCVEVAHFICSAIITSCWHQVCWHQLTTPVRPKGGGGLHLNSGPGLIWQETWTLNYESGRSLI